MVLAIDGNIYIFISGTLSNPSTFTEGTSYDSDTESVISSVSEFQIGQDKKKTFNKLFTDMTKVSGKKGF